MSLKLNYKELTYNERQHEGIQKLSDIWYRYYHYMYQRRQTAFTWLDYHNPDMPEKAILERMNDYLDVVIEPGGLEKARRLYKVDGGIWAYASPVQLRDDGQAIFIVALPPCESSRLKVGLYLTRYIWKGGGVVELLDFDIRDHYNWRELPR
jgi:hypothetical protein